MRRVRRTRVVGPGRYLVARAGYFVFLIALFVVGVGFGAAAVRAIGDPQKLELVEYMELYLRGLSADRGEVAAADIWRQAVSANLRTGALLWASGPLVIGILVAPAVVFMRGFVIGFAVGFLTYEFGLRGVLLGALGVFPQNLIAVPAMLIIAASTVSFGVYVLRRQTRGAAGFRTELAGYTVVIVAMMLALIVSATLEAYLAPVLMRLIAVYGRG